MDKIVCYVYVLLDFDDNVIMGTELDEPNPLIDTEFWNRFMEGDCYMRYSGQVIEEIDEENDDE